MDPLWREEVEKISHRHYSTGFWYGYPGQFYEDARYIRDWQVCAIVESCDENGLARFVLNNKFRVSDELEIVGPDTRPFSYIAADIRDLEGNSLEEPRTPQMQFTMQLPCRVPAHSLIRRAVDLSAK